MSTTTARTKKTVHELYDEWRSSYNSRSYMLARMTAEEMLQAAPDSAEVHFVTALTYVSLRNFREAAKEFQKTAEGIQSGRRGESFLPPEYGKNVGPVTIRCLEGLEQKKLTWGPTTALSWLRDPDTVGEVIAKPAIGVGGELIGRVEPLVDMANGKPLGSRPYQPIGGVLSEEITALWIDRPTMRDLLGKDADIKIDRYDASINRAPITIIDDTIKIKTGDIVIRTENEKLIDNSIRIIDDTVRIDRDYLSDEERKRREQTERKTIESRKARDARERAHIDPGGAWKPAVTARPSSPSQAATPPSPRSATTVAPPPPPTGKPAAAKPKAAKVATAAAATAAAATAAAGAAAAASAKAEKAGTAVDEWAKWEQDLEALVRSGQYSEAIKRVEAAVGRFPKSSRLQEALAQTLEKSGRKEQAAAAWAETVRKATAAGSRERAERALRNAADLAKENADLLHDLAGLAAGLASLGLAASIGKMAADVYRRREDRPKLMAVLRQLREWGVGDPALENELSRLENDPARSRQASPAKGKDAPPAAQGGRSITSGPPADAGDYGRVKPPGAGGQAPPPPINAGETRPDIMGGPMARGASGQETEAFDVGLAFMIGSVVILIIAAFGGSTMLPLVYLVLIHAIQKMKEGAAKAAGKPAESLATLKTAKVVAIVALIASFFSCG